MDHNGNLGSTLEIYLNPEALDQEFRRYNQRHEGVVNFRKKRIGWMKKYPIGQVGCQNEAYYSRDKPRVIRQSAIF